MRTYCKFHVGRYKIMKKQKHLYLIFSHTTGRMGEMIRTLTQYDYNHVSIFPKYIPSHAAIRTLRFTVVLCVKALTDLIMITALPT